MIDAHHHLWKYNSKDYDWMDDSMQILKQDYLPGDIYREATGAGVKGSVVVQARQSLAETEWLLDIAGKYPFIKGVVGWVDLKSDTLSKELEKYAIHPCFVGVRHVLQDEPDDHFMLREEFLRGISQLSSYNLTYDLLILPRHLKNAAKLVGKFPEQRFVIDHLAKPLIKEQKLEPWKEDIQRLADFPNVWCKISGMVTEADHNHWQQADFNPYLDIVTRAFGVGRIMTGSDWPVCRLAAEYSDVLNIHLEYYKNYDEKDKEKIFNKNCLDFYNIQ